MAPRRRYGCSLCCEKFARHAPGYCDRAVCAWAADFAAYNTRFAMPGRRSATPTPAAARSMYWALDYKSVHFVALNTGEAGDPTTQARYGDQLAWLEADLSAVDRSATPWVVVSAHYRSGRRYQLVSRGIAPLWV